MSKEVFIIFNIDKGELWKDIDSVMYVDSDGIPHISFGGDDVTDIQGLIEYDIHEEDDVTDEDYRILKVCDKVEAFLNNKNISKKYYKDDIIENIKENRKKIGKKLILKNK